MRPNDAWFAALTTALVAACGKAVYSGNCEPDDGKTAVVCHITNSGDGKGHVCFESHQTHRRTGKDLVSKTVCTDVLPNQTFKTKAEFDGVDIAKECVSAQGVWVCEGKMTVRYNE
jgi:hypothetical protein